MAKWWSMGVVLLLALGAVPARAQENQAIASASVDRVRLGISSNDSELVLLAKLPSEPEYSALCAPPCSVPVRPAAYELALRRSGGGLVPARQLFHVGQDSRLEVEYESHAQRRAAGWVILALGVLGERRATDDRVSYDLVPAAP